jgi:hypothetical protein
MIHTVLISFDLAIHIKSPPKSSDRPQFVNHGSICNTSTHLGRKVFYSLCAADWADLSVGLHITLPAPHANPLLLHK